MLSKTFHLEVRNRAPSVFKELFLWSTFILLRAGPGEYQIYVSVNSNLVVNTLASHAVSILAT